MFTLDAKLLPRLTMALCLGGCVSSDPTTAGERAAMVTTKSGLTVPRPEGFDAAEDDARLVFVEHGDLRSPRRISVWLADAPPPLEHARQDGDIHYAQEEVEGGSGGPVHVLRAYKAVERGFIVLEAEVQQELGTPDFALARSVLARAK